MKVDPMAAFQMLQPKPDDQVTVAPGGTVWSKRDQKALFTAPDKADKPDPDIALLEMVHGKGTPAFFQALKQLSVKKTTHAPSASATIVMPPQEKEENKAVGKYFGDQYADIQKSGLAAGQTVNRLAQIKNMLQGVETGKLTPLTTDIAGYAQAFGINLDPKLDAKQAIDAMSNEMALQMRNPAGGAGMPGALSDKDREFLVKIVPGLSKTPGGNQMIIEARMKLAQREQVVARMAREYRSRRGVLDEGFYEELQRYSDANPLYDGMVQAAPNGTDIGGGFRLKGN